MVEVSGGLEGGGGWNDVYAFYNISKRRKALKSPSKEHVKLSEVVSR